MLLTLIAAPLVVFGFERTAAEEQQVVTPAPAARLHDFTLSTIAFAVCIWVWHWPGPYDATLQNNAVYWLMHMTTFGSALWLWHALLQLGRHHWGPALLAGFFTGIQMTLLGALLTFAGRSLFVVHAATTQPWGLSALEDQQLGGLIMGVVGGLLFTIYGVVAFGVLLLDWDKREATVVPTHQPA
jgi:putative membrane protein